MLGSGLEMAAFCGNVNTVSAPAPTLGLPELAFGLLPGAGGTVSITRRIGRWRTAYLVLSGLFIDPATALDWGLVDEVGEAHRAAHLSSRSARGSRSARPAAAAEIVARDLALSRSVELRAVHGVEAAADLGEILCGAARPD